MSFVISKSRAYFVTSRVVHSSRLPISVREAKSDFKKRLDSAQNEGID